MASICVFCGSQSGQIADYTDAARKLARILADNDHTLVYGGGSVGLMGALADQMLANNGRVTGVIPEALANVELMHGGVSDMRIVPDMHTRKATMHELADAYVALPGGYGTLEELFEVLCWGQLQFHSAPVALLNCGGFFSGLVSQLDHMVSHGFLSRDHRRILYTTADVEDLEHWLHAVGEGR